eukprot:scaffold2090_cov225-Prasinococcus_capsulatus_cf.AAC.5
MLTAQPVLAVAHDVEHYTKAPNISLLAVVLLDSAAHDDLGRTVGVGAHERAAHRIGVRLGHSEVADLHEVEALPTVRATRH